MPRASRLLSNGPMPRTGSSKSLAETPIPGVVRFHYHTLVWQYLSAAVRARIDAAFDKAGAAATAETPLAMFRFENDMRGDGGLMELTLWPGGERVRSAAPASTAAGLGGPEAIGRRRFSCYGNGSRPILSPVAYARCPVPHPLSLA